MKLVMLATILGLAAHAEQAPEKQGIAVGERLAAAIKGEAEFQDRDFVNPLAEADKAALRSFASCKVKNIGPLLYPDPERPEFLVPQFDQVLMRFNCKGVPSATPVGITLHLQDGKVGKIETHNADLMRAD